MVRVGLNGFDLNCSAFDKTRQNQESLWPSPKTCLLFMSIYNIPRACLLNRSPVPAMDIKSNRSGLWRHMLETCRRLRRLCHKHSNNVARHDKKLQLSQNFCRATKIFCHATWISCRVGLTLCCDFYTFRCYNTCTFSLPTFAVLRHTT